MIHTELESRAGGLCLLQLCLRGGEFRVGGMSYRVVICRQRRFVVVRRLLQRGGLGRHRDEGITCPADTIVRGLRLINGGFGILGLRLEHDDLICGWTGTDFVVILLRGVKRCLRGCDISIVCG